MDMQIDEPRAEQIAMGFNDGEPQGVVLRPCATDLGDYALVNNTVTFDKPFGCNDCRVSYPQIPSINDGETPFSGRKP